MLKGNQQCIVILTPVLYLNLNFMSGPPDILGVEGIVLLDLFVPLPKVVKFYKSLSLLISY